MCGCWKKQNKKNTPSKSCSNKMQLGTKEKVHIEQQKKVLSKTEQGSVNGKESWVSTACTIPSTECHNMMCCNKLSGFSGNSRGKSQLSHSHRRAHRSTSLTSLRVHLQTCEFTVPHTDRQKNPHRRQHGGNK